MTRPLPPAEAPITEDDAFLAEALESASIPTLMMSLIHMTGDASLLRGEIRPGRAVLGETQGMMTEAQKAQVRADALEVLKRFRDGGCVLPPPPAPETIHAMMSFIVGEEVPAEYVPMMLEEMALDGEDARDIHWSPDAAREAKRRFPVLVVGAGMSGLLAAIRLEEAGVPYTVVEKNDGVGGTWYENTYPGCRVDISNHFYSYSFEPHHDWPEFYSRQPALRAYFERCADEYGVRPRIRFGTEVVSAVFDEAANRWRVTLRDAEGREQAIEVAAVVSAVGQLNRPYVPDFEGRDDFAGPAFHSAAWEHQHDLTGKRVALIGSAASALQLAPEVAERAAKLTIFQRSPAWMFPNPHYHRRVSEGMKWLLKHVPYYARWYRFLAFWPGSDGLLPSLIVDPDWPHPERAVNALNDEQREIFTEYMKSQLGDDPELLEKVIPKYPPFGKRMLQDNGSWLGTLKRENVELVTDGVARITPDAIVDGAGVEHPVDVIVYATGFRANEFLAPMEIVGRGGVKLNERWGDEPKAYLGITVPGFPNLFCLYGPATNLAHAGSIIFHSECQVRYVMGCIRGLIERGHAAMDCRPEVHERYDDELQATLARTVWAHPGVDSWYKNSRGRVTTTSPWRLLDYWHWTREPDFDDYEILD